jgi:nitrate reductase alpha subunit
MPTPSKFRWVVNVNVLNNAKHHYDMVRNVDPNIETLICQDIEMTSDVNHNDIAFAANSWMEFTYPEMTVTVSTLDSDLEGGSGPSTIPAMIWILCRGRREVVGHDRDKRMKDYFKLSTRTASTSMRSGCSMRRAPSTAIARRHAEVGKRLDGDDPHLSANCVLGRDQRIEAHVDPDGAVRELPHGAEAIEYGENFISHREGRKRPLSPECDHDHQRVCAPGRLRHSHHGAAP